MDRSKVLTLIAKSYTQDAIGQQVPVETQRDVYCNISGVSGQEFFVACRSGIRPEIRVTLFAFDYNSETVVELEGVRYGVYRTYLKNNEDIELYLERKVGV